MTRTTGYHTDFAFQSLSLGDDVVFVCPYNRYLRFGKLIDWRGKSFRVEWIDEDGEQHALNVAPRRILKATELQASALAWYKLGGHNEE